LSKVIDPYCDCSLSPNRLIFGPLIIIILLFIQLLYTMKKKIKIKLNGKLKAINNNSTLFNIVQKNKIPLAKVAIELNQEIVDKKKIKSINLKNNDKIEIVHFIGGG